jgi:2-methylcitrate dehydratase
MRGESAPSPIYEGDYGILAVLLGGAEAELHLPSPDQPLRAILSTLPKAHSAGYHGQAIIDLALRLHRRNLDLAAIQSVTLHTKRMTHMVMGSGSGDPDKWDPAASRETLDHSAPFQFARALVDGFWHHDHSYDPARIAEADFVALWRKVATQEDPVWNHSFDAAAPLDKHHGARAVITYQDGSQDEMALAVADSHPKGAAPWTVKDYLAKFDSLTAEIVSAPERAAFVAGAQNLGALGVDQVYALGVTADLIALTTGPMGLFDRPLPKGQAI